MGRYAFLIAYDGTRYHGWQKQPEDSTVQGEIENVLEQLFQQPIEIQGSGRTDAGVHALNQVAHADLPEGHQALNNLRQRMNSLLHSDIHVRGISNVPEDFHARFDAQDRSYIYRLSNRYNPLQRNTVWTPKYEFDPEKLQDLGRMFDGEMDFCHFTKRASDQDHTRSIIYRSEWIMTAKESGAVEMEYHITAKRFLHNMVRLLVGSMYKVAAGRMKRSAFEQLLKTAPTNTQPYRAPAHGLVLSKVFYQNLKFDLT